MSTAVLGDFQVRSRAPPSTLTNGGALGCCVRCPCAACHGKESFRRTGSSILGDSTVPLLPVVAAAAVVVVVETFR